MIVEPMPSSFIVGRTVPTLSELRWVEHGMIGGRGRARGPKKGRGRPSRGELHLNSMHPLKARVHNGLLVLDEPTDLPEGEVVYLRPVDDDDMTDDERAALHESIRESLEQMDRGQLIDADDALARLRAHR
jgi:hypothetical protein